MLTLAEDGFTIKWRKDLIYQLVTVTFLQETFKAQKRRAEQKKILKLEHRSIEVDKEKRINPKMVK